MPKTIKAPSKTNKIFLNAAKKGDWKTLKLLLRYDDSLTLSNPLPDINCCDENGLTALHFAYAYGSHELVQILVQRGAKEDIRDKKGRLPKDFFTRIININPLLWSIKQGDQKKFNDLLDIGMNLQYRGCSPFLLLRQAVCSKRPDMLMQLLQKGVDVNSISHRFATTPLMDAILLGNFTEAFHLLDNGASIDLSPSNGGLCAIDYAIIREISADHSEEKSRRKIFFAKMMRYKYPEISDTEIERYKKLSLMQLLLKLSYSSLSVAFPSYGSIGKLLIEILDEIDLPKERKDFLEEVLWSMHDNQGVFTKDQTQFFSFKSRLDSHASYFLVECDDKKNPKYVHYIDGARYSFHEADQGEAGVYKFKVDEKKIPDFESLQEQLLKVTSINRGDNESKWFGPGLTPIWKSLYTKQQKRGNCSFKSAMLFIRAIDDLIYDRPTRIIEGSLDGEGYALHKEFKYAIIAYAFKELLEMARPDNPEKICQKQAYDFLEKVILPTAIKKANSGEPHAVELAENILTKLQEIGINEEGKSPAISVIKPKLYFLSKSVPIKLPNF